METIDTKYDDLLDVPANIREFYSEEERTKVTGYTPGEDSKPIYKPYKVVVLNAPAEVTYDYVESRKSRGFGSDVVKEVLKNAIDWEYFDVNHNQYLQWEKDYNTWEEDKPTTIKLNAKGIEVEVITDAPVRPTIDMALRRALYGLEIVPNLDHYTRDTDEFTDTVDDDELVIKRLYKSVPLSDKEIDHIRKLEGVEFNGVMCSAHKEDFWGLSGIEPWIRMGNDTMWDFKNGNQVLLTKDNIDKFYSIWVPFRASFFQVVK